MRAVAVNMKGGMAVGAVVTVVALVVAASVALTATAEPGRRGGRGDGPGHGGPGQGHGPCAEDAKRLCADVEPGDGRIHACLQEKAAQASAECQTQMARGEERRAKMEAFKAACGEDLQRVCGVSLPAPGEGPGKGGQGADKGHGKGKGPLADVKACVETHKAELSPTCVAMVEDFEAERAQHKAKRQAVKDACQADVQTFCGDVIAEGKGKGVRRRVAECLKTHERQLSGECSAAIKAAHP